MGAFPWQLSQIISPDSFSHILLPDQCHHSIEIGRVLREKPIALFSSGLMSLNLMIALVPKRTSKGLAIPLAISHSYRPLINGRIVGVAVDGVGTGTA
jgi:hypothetical protein